MLGFGGPSPPGTFAQSIQNKIDKFGPPVERTAKVLIWNDLICKLFIPCGLPASAGAKIEKELPQRGGGYSFAGRPMMG
jgi:hypothetical protein